MSETQMRHQALKGCKVPEALATIRWGHRHELTCKLWAGKLITSAIKNSKSFNTGSTYLVSFLKFPRCSKFLSLQIWTCDPNLPNTGHRKLQGQGKGWISNWDFSKALQCSTASCLAKYPGRYHSPQHICCESCCLATAINAVFPLHHFP